MNRKKTNKEFSCVMVFKMRPGSTFQFAFGFNECLWEIFSLDYYIWKNFWFHIWVGLWLYDFWFYDTNDFESLFTPCRWIKNLSVPKKTTRKRNLQKASLIAISWESYKKSIFWLTFSIYMVQTFLKIIWWQFFVPGSERLISSATLSYLRHAIFQLFQC